MIIMIKENSTTEEMQSESVNLRVSALTFIRWVLKLANAMQIN